MSGNRAPAELVRDLGWGAWWAVRMVGAWCGVWFNLSEARRLTAQLNIEKNVC